MNNISLEQNIEKNNNLQNNIEKKQKSFLETNIGKAINSAVNFGLKVILPDFMEDEIIEVKDALVKGGFKEATTTAIDNAINLGKSFLGIFSGKFENISQVKKAIEKGGLIDSMSDVLDNTINWAKDKKHISSSTSKLIKSGKKEIIESIKNGVDNELEDQVEAIDKMNGYIEKWGKYYNEQNFDRMDYQYKKINEYMDKIMPIENIIKKANEVKNLHTIIKNNGKNFNISQEEQELAKMLVN